MILTSNQSLKAYNSFGLDVPSERYCEIASSDDIMQFCDIVRSDKTGFLILGGGSNILFTRGFRGITARMTTRGITPAGETDAHMFIKVEAGEVWDDVVNFCTKNNYGGIENLSGIPGTAGAAPVQNIGAYGAELKDCFHELQAVEISSGTSVTFSREDCRFGYRDSVFQRELKNRFIISSVTLKLDKNPVLKTEYGAIAKELKNMGCNKPGISDLSTAVKKIRSARIPDVHTCGSAGSFFKNPVIGKTDAVNLQSEYPDVTLFPVTGDTVKVPAGWLIEHCGWKGYREGQAGVYPMQALIIVNYGGASGCQVLNIAMKIRESVWRRFGILLEPEVNIL